jgi:hypothetical protein
MSGYVAIGVIGLSYSIYYLVTSKKSVYASILFSTLLTVSCSLLTLGMTIWYRSKQPLGQEITLKLPYVPPSLVGLDQLPVNRYPFLGSHDSATFLQENTNRPWLITMLGYLNKWAYTQSLDFVKQYEAGARYFDLRFQFSEGDTTVVFRHGDAQVAGMDLGIIFYPPSNPKYISLDHMLDKCIEEKECIIMSIKQEQGNKPLYDGEPMTEPLQPNRSIQSNFASYLRNSQTGKNYLPSIYWVNSAEELNHSVAWFKQQQKYIIAIRPDVTRSNWDVSVVCQSGPVGSVFLKDACNNDSCANPNSLVWSTGIPGGLLTQRTTGFFDYINQVYQKFIRDKPTQLEVTQAMFQSYSSSPNLKNGIPISIQDCVKGDITQIESIAHVAYRMYEYMIHHPEYVTNIMFMDNIGTEESPFMVDGKYQSWSKMCWYQLVSNINRRRQQGDPMYA